MSINTFNDVTTDPYCLADESTSLTHQGGSMDLQEQQHESRQRQLPTQPRLRQTVTYSRHKPSVSPDEDLRSEVKMSLLKVSVLVMLY